MNEERIEEVVLFVVDSFNRFSEKGIPTLYKFKDGTYTLTEEAEKKLEKLETLGKEPSEQECLEVIDMLVSSGELVPTKWMNDKSGFTKALEEML